ncbi:uncharacterized protein isoform X3 [Castor canadensis]|uniref:Uncharacterized protein isoform X3 n=1 Tax=Castor canadensis TaxID=51338 RepID=A0AC58LBN9_CASCN
MTAMHSEGPGAGRRNHAQGYVIGKARTWPGCGVSSASRLVRGTPVVAAFPRSSHSHRTTSWSLRGRTWVRFECPAILHSVKWRLCNL